ncbi:NAD(P)-binding protein [Aspergillus insuetus]
MASLGGVALVTGAGSGIGRHLCEAYARAGCRAIALADVNANGIKETAALLNGLDVQLLEIEVDVTSEASVRDMVSKAVECFGSIDYAVNAAGVSTPTRLPTAEYPLGEYDRLLNINARSILLCMQEEVRAMQKQPPTCTPGVRPKPLRQQRGSIINIASVTSLAALQNVMPYNVSKHAVLGLTKSAAIDHSQDQIRINAVCPGMTETPMVQARQALVEQGKTSNWAVQGNGLQRLALPEEIADVCVFLSGCGASYMTGASVVVDAGHLAALRYEPGLSRSVELQSAL